MSDAGEAKVTDEEVRELEAQLGAYMDRKGLRSTSQRRLVSDVFFRSAGHLTLDDVLSLVRAQDPGVGYATVYRTMKLLVECGLAQRAADRGALDGLRQHRVVEMGSGRILRARTQVDDRHGVRAKRSVGEHRIGPIRKAQIVESPRVPARRVLLAIPSAL